MAKFMEPGIILVVLLILGIPISLAVWLIVRAVSANEVFQSDNPIFNDEAIRAAKGCTVRPTSANGWT